MNQQQRVVIEEPVTLTLSPRDLQNVVDGVAMLPINRAGETYGIIQQQITESQSKPSGEAEG